MIHLRGSAVWIQKTGRHGDAPLHKKAMQQKGHAPHQAVVQEPNKNIKILGTACHSRIILGLGFLGSLGVIKSGNNMQNFPD